jgi:hypothetical protein
MQPSSLDISTSVIILLHSLLPSVKALFQFHSPVMVTPVYLWSPVFGLHYILCVHSYSMKKLLQYWLLQYILVVSMQDAVLLCQRSQVPHIICSIYYSFAWISLLSPWPAWCLRMLQFIRAPWCQSTLTVKSSLPAVIILGFWLGGGALVFYLRLGLLTCERCPKGQIDHTQMC